MKRWILIVALVTASGSAVAQESSMIPQKPFGIVGAPQGSGQWPAVAESNAGLPAHTLYHPDAKPVGALPLILWGNGACRDNGLQHAMFLREVASHGYFVIALGWAREERGVMPPPSATTSPPPPPPPAPRATPDETDLAQMGEAIGWATVETGREGSPFKGWIDVSRIAVMGHSCGGLQAIAMSADPRIGTSLIFNSGVYNSLDGGGRSGIKVGKDALEKLHAPIAYFAGGPTDIAHPNAADDVARIAKVPVFFGELPVGHGGTFWSDPNGGEWARVAVLWLDWRLKGDPAAGGWFAGKGCGLCQDPRWTVVRKGME